MICDSKSYINLNAAFSEELCTTHVYGEEVQSRGAIQKERLFVSFHIEDPTQLDITVPARRFNREYATLEWLWYISRNSKVNNIGKLARIWVDIQDQFGEVESNYGTYIFDDQWQWIINEIKNDSDTRRATIVINQPDHKSRNDKDYPCTHYLHFFIREGYLHLGAYMRSNDAVFGFCNDAFSFCLFQQLMLNELRDHYPTLKLGYYYHSAGSFHVYERHFKMMENIANNYYPQVVANGHPEVDPLKLKRHITWNYIVQNGLALPSFDMSKEEIIEFTIKKSLELFE